MGIAIWFNFVSLNQLYNEILLLYNRVADVVSNKL